MSKSLAELRQSPRVGLPERTYDLCLASTLVGEVQSLISDLEDAEVEAAQKDGDAVNAPPRRAGQQSPVAEIRTRLSALRAEMADHTGTLTLHGVSEGQWRTWVDEHPAREDNARDKQIAWNCCNADDLLDDLERYASAWNGEPLKPGDWDFILSNAAPGDVKALVQIVVSMHEMAVNVPKLLSSSLGILDAENA